MSSVPVTSPAGFAGGCAEQWRATQPGLWVGRRDGRHLGTVERGRRYLAVDAAGEPIGSYSTLEAAMAAVAKQCSTRRSAVASAWPWAPLAFTAAVVATAAATAALGASGLLLF